MALPMVRSPARIHNTSKEEKRISAFTLVQLCECLRIRRQGGPSMVFISQIIKGLCGTSEDEVIHPAEFMIVQVRGAKECAGSQPSFAR